MPKANDPGSDAVELGTSSDPNMAEEMRRARRDQSADPAPEDKADFPVQSEGDAVWLTNRNGGTHDVPSAWVTQDEVGVVRVRGNLGYRYASDKEISRAQSEQGLDGNGNAKATEGSHSANAEAFEVTDHGSQEPQTASMGHASTSASAKGTKSS